jgi:hypothetical protein
MIDAPRGVVAPRAFERAINLDVKRDDLVILPCIVDSNPQPEYRFVHLVPLSLGTLTFS